MSPQPSTVPSVSTHRRNKNASPRSGSDRQCENCFRNKVVIDGRWCSDRCEYESREGLL